MTEKKQQHISWQVHPIREEPVIKSILLGLLITLIVIFSYLLGGIYYALTSLIILLLSLRSYFFKTTYTLNDQEISSKSFLVSTIKKWKQFRRYKILTDLIVLSPFEKTSRLDQFRATILKIPYDMDKSDIEKFLKIKFGNLYD